MRRSAFLLSILGAGAVFAARAADVPPPANVVNLSATVVEQVTQDWLSITLAATREGNDAAAVQRQLKQVLEGALADARRDAAPGQVEVRTGRFQVFPRYGRDGKLSGWQGTAELWVAGRDVGKVAALAGRLNGLVVTQSGYSLSRELREQREAALAAAAIQKFRQRAQETAVQFGFKGYGVREVSVNALEQGGPPPVAYAMRAKTLSADEAAAAPVPTEPGQGELSATVQGSVQLLP
jgi:predicted secreted protein